MKSTTHKVISFCLWGQDPKYIHGAVKNAELAKEIYPGWKCRFYVASSVPSTIVSILSSYDHVEVIRRESWGDWKSMFWRFEPASDPDVDVMISRDTDSRLSLREKAAVDEWINSDCGFHIMRDHPYHKFPVLGGMWGAKKGTCDNIKKLIEEFGGTDQYGTDYAFFVEKVLPTLKPEQIMTHDEFFDKKPFPTKRINYEFVGEVYDKDDNRFLEHVEILKKTIQGEIHENR